MEIDRRRQALVEADRQVRVLEKLRDRKLKEYEREELLKEVRDMDEISMQVSQASEGTHQWR